MTKKRTVAFTIATALAAWAASKAIIKPTVRELKPVLQTHHPIILSYGGCLKNGLTHTLEALENCIPLGLDGFSLDICLTADEKIVVLPPQLEKIFQPPLLICEKYTLLELQEKVNKYRPKQSNTLLTLEEVLNYFPTMKMNLCIKDSPTSYAGSLIPSKLWALLEQTHATDRVIIASSFDEQIDRFNLYAQNQFATGGQVSEFTKAYAAFSSSFGHLYKPSVDNIQVPAKIGLLSTTSPAFVNFLHQRNMTIFIQLTGNEQLLTTSLTAGVDGIITDDPETIIRHLLH